MVTNSYGQSIGGGASGITTGGFDSGTGRIITPTNIGGGHSHSGGGSSNRNNNTTQQTVVSVNGNVVTINGQGYSVVPGQQEQFLASKGLSGSSYNTALEQAKTQDAIYKQQQEQIKKTQEANNLKELAIKNNKLNNLDNQMTSTNLVNMNIALPSVKTEPYFRQDITGYVPGTNTPIREYTYVDPTNEGVQQERPVTPEEFKYIQDQPKDLKVIEVPFYRPIIAPVENLAGNLNQDLKDTFTKYIDVEKATDILYETTTLNPLSYGLSKIQGGEDFIKGYIKGNVQDIKDNPLKQVILLGAGYGTGLAFGGISAGLGAIPKIGNVLGTTFRAGSIGYGLYSGAEFIGQTATNIQNAENISQAGSILGVNVKDALLLGYGFNKGEKAFDIIQSRVRTAGLKETNIQ